MVFILHLGIEIKNSLWYNKPWGSFRRFIHNTPATVKILTVLPKEELSLQSHNKRREFWRVIKGSGFIQIEDELKEVHENDEQFISQGMKHRIIASDEGIKIMEIGFGDFDEDDIIRYEDKYGRVK
jgi:mannose-6-phosphate isomerase